MAEDVLLALPFEMQRRTHAQQKVLGVVEPRRIGRTATQQQRIGEQRNRPRREQVAQGAGRVLHVRLELIERAVERRVTLVDQVEQRLEDEAVRRRGVKDRGEAIEQIAFAGDRPGVDEREQEFRVVGFERLEVAELAHLMADDDAEIPERMQERAERLLLVRTNRIAEEDQDIDVGVETEMAAAVAAEREDRRGRRDRGRNRRAAAGRWRRRARHSARAPPVRPRRARIGAQLVARRIQDRARRNIPRLTGEVGAADGWWNRHGQIRIGSGTAQHPCAVPDETRERTAASYPPPAGSVSVRKAEPARVDELVRLQLSVVLRFVQEQLRRITQPLVFNAEMDVPVPDLGRLHGQLVGIDTRDAAKAERRITAARRLLIVVLQS